MLTYGYSFYACLHYLPAGWRLPTLLAAASCDILQPLMDIQLYSHVTATSSILPGQVGRLTFNPHLPTIQILQTNMPLPHGLYFILQQGFGSILPYVVSPVWPTIMCLLACPRFHLVVQLWFLY